ncbi:MAG: AmmeMemoRadiSam system protein B, partial [Epsilonproteobacteria bacterium]|nr:AmmeMemoRadiSam system protein B [Campylobacterota bacterium]
AKELQEHFGMPQQNSAHREHSTEVQFALLKHYISHAKIVELVYSHETPHNIARVIEHVLNKEGWGVIISTDLSHFYTQTQANILDNICIEAIEQLDTKRLHEGCEACGIIGVEAMMIAAQNNELKPTILDYRTSADASGDNSRVVGYLSVAFS